MSRIVEDAFRRFEERMPSTAQARNYDPHFNHQATLLRHMLSLVDMVMEDEGVHEHVRSKVVRGVLYGYPNPADAELRMKQQEALTEALKTQPIVMPERWRP